MKASRTKFIKIVPFVAGVLSVSYVHAQQVTPKSDGLKWVSAPASLPAGAKLAILKGDLAKHEAFAFRLKLPAGYQLKPQSSPAIDRMVVVSGTFNLGAGKKFDRARTIPMQTGYVHWPDQSPYFAFTKEETILQVEGVGPWAVKYVNPSDDPMRKE
jgi:hypothetical protein